MDYKFGDGRNGQSNPAPPKHPPDAQTLMLRREDANSRFLTDCYLFPAAVWSGACPKLDLATLEGHCENANRHCQPDQLAVPFRAKIQVKQMR